MIIPQIQSLRFLFMLLIVASHLSMVGFPAFDAGGDCGVAFFFVLSGYVTMMSRHEQLEKGTFKHRQFLLKNLRRIYPLYFITWLVAVLLMHNWSYLLHALPSLLLVQSWIPSPQYYFGGNGVEWFLSSLLLAWLALPWLYRFIKTRYGMLALLTCYLLLVIMLPEAKVNAWLYVFPPVRLVDFALGMALYRGSTTQNLSRFSHGSRSLSLYACIGFIGVIASLCIYPYLAPQLRNALIFWPFICMIIGTTHALPPSVNRLLSHPTLVFLGNHTLEIFLTHHLIFRIIARSWS